MYLNQGRFLPNGFCGYILKPEFQRDPSSQFHPNKLTKGPWLKKKNFHIMVRDICYYLKDRCQFELPAESLGVTHCYIDWPMFRLILMKKISVSA